MSRPGNIAADSFLPLVRASGKRFVGRPSDILSEIEIDPVTAIDLGREPLNAYAFEFLVSLFTTAVAPLDDDEWTDWFRSPPSVSVVQARMEAISRHFEVGVFMQDTRNGAFDEKKVNVNSYGIRSLDYSAAGAETALFSSHDSVKAVSPHVAALLAYGYQSCATSGGRGRQTSMRGGGPLSVMPILGRTLFHAVWGNVLTAEDLRWDRRSGLDGLFAWENILGLDLGVKVAALPSVTSSTAHKLTPYW